MIGFGFPSARPAADSGCGCCCCAVAPDKQFIRYENEAAHDRTRDTAFLFAG
jgi:hypothetical protein